MSFDNTHIQPTIRMHLLQKLNEKNFSTFCKSTHMRLRISYRGSRQLHFKENQQLLLRHEQIGFHT